MEISKKFGSYNERRYGNPWGAVVTFDQDAKIQYDFKGSWLGGRGESGEVVINLVEGQTLVAFGQKDHRGKNSENTIYQVQEDGSLLEVTKVQAYKIWKERNGI